MRLLIKIIQFLTATIAGFIVTIAIVGYFQVEIPVLKIKENCNPSWPNHPFSSEEIVEATAARLSKFYEKIDAFAIKNDGRIVYLDIEIEASSSSLSCAIEEGNFGDYIDDKTVTPNFWFNSGEDRWSSEFIFTLQGPYGGTWRLAVPVNQRKLPKNGQYKAMEHGKIMSVEGPFFVEHLESNGFGQVTLYPQTGRVLSEKEMNCSKFRLSNPAWLRSFIPCF